MIFTSKLQNTSKNISNASLKKAFLNIMPELVSISGDILGMPEGQSLTRFQVSELCIFVLLVASCV
jgi:hypothetical protein